MNGYAWRAELRRLLLCAGLSLVVGLIFSLPFLGLAIGSLGYSLSVVIQVRRLDQWFTGKSDEVPEAVGVWGDLLDKIYRLQRRERQAQDELRATIRKVQQSVDALADGVIMAGQNSELEWCNRSARRLLGVQPGRDLGQPIVNLLRDPRFKTYFEDKEYDEPLSLTLPNRPDTLLQLHLTLFGKNNRMIIVRDVTRIARLERMRSDFVANVSHELKTPITVLRGYFEQMMTVIDTMPERWQKPIQSMNGQTMRMDALVTDLLTLSRLESGHPPKDQQLIDMKSMIEQIKTEMEDVTSRPIELKVADVGLLGSPNEVRSALTNLVINAVKYSQVDSPIKIYWRPSRDGAYMSLQVRDSGKGIAPEHLPRLTERFYRVDAGRSTATGGTGLGLAIVKHIMLRHDGRLIIDSELGRGSRFSCRFPLFRLRPSAVEVKQGQLQKDDLLKVATP